MGTSASGMDGNGYIKTELKQKDINGINNILEYFRIKYKILTKPDEERKINANRNKKKDK